MAFAGGSFHSGDLAIVYPDGAIAVLDRSKDIIISGGEVGIATWKIQSSNNFQSRMHHRWP